MSETYTLKEFFSPPLVQRLARSIKLVHPSFDEKSFARKASRGLGQLEFLDRGRHIARVLADHLPEDFPEAVNIVLRSLGPEHSSDELLGAGMAPFFYYPHTIFVAEHGLEHFELSMQAQYELTKRFSCESSIRPFIAKDPERTFALLRKWTRDRNPHVRRLVSEGTRLRLPWSMRVAWLDAHPERILELLQLLKDDPASVVRRSVANNLNDFGKVHPALLVRTCSAWLENATPERRALVEHALRGTIKRGDSAALKLLGYGPRPSIAITNVRFDPEVVQIGNTVRMDFLLASKSARTQDLLVDVAVHFVQARGTSAKVFKLKRIRLAPKESISLSTKFSLKVHTTRVPRPGTHAVDVIVNGVSFTAGSFTVKAPGRSRRRH